MEPRAGGGEKKGAGGQGRGLWLFPVLRPGWGHRGSQGPPPSPTHMAGTRRGSGKEPGDAPVVPPAHPPTSQPVFSGTLAPGPVSVLLLTFLPWKLRWPASSAPTSSGTRPSLVACGPSPVRGSSSSTAASDEGVPPARLPPHPLSSAPGLPPSELCGLGSVLHC